jgi:hypothetical protein
MHCEPMAIISECSTMDANVELSRWRVLLVANDRVSKVINIA